MEKIARCIRETGNWSNLSKEHRFDSQTFSSDKVQKDIKYSAPKLYALINKIKELDEKDMKKNGKVFKHFIYSDVKSPYGAKLIASALASHGYTHAYDLVKTPKGMSFKLKSNLSKYNNNVFATLTSVLFFEKPIGVRFRKDLLATYNKRPDNIYGNDIRIIILDSGFREGIDLFDVKYVHIFEPLMTRSDEKQAIGRATRFCGQKGLHFEKNIGWPLYVFKYETIIPKEVNRALLANNADLAPADTFFNLFLKFSNIDPKKITLANQLESLVIYSAVDRYLTKNVHNFEIEDLTQNRQFNDIFSGGKELGKFQKMQKYIRDNFSQYKWPVTKIENGCLQGPIQANQGGPSIIQFSPTQNFVRNFFTSNSNYKGLLLMHSVGTGKTCSAIAVASSTFEKDDYTIIYVTRHTLKADVWKNMFGQTCSVIIQDLIKKGVSIPEATSQRAKMIKAWMEPMSYKQFSNALQGKNSIYHDLVKRNGKKDLLKKTLIIIDEAHKLFAPDVTGGEKPDTDEIKKAFLNSYDISGKDSAKVLLMTATPYTDDPMDMIRLLNMFREKNKQLPESFEDFQSLYLDQDGKFTIDGKNKFLDDVTGYISYLNREKDVRSFSYPIVDNINVELSKYEFASDLIKYMDLTKTRNHDKLHLDVLKSELNTNRINYSMKLKEDYQKELDNMREDYEKCKQNTIEYVKGLMDNLNKNKKHDLEQCNVIKKNCEQRLKELAKESDSSSDKKDKLQECKDKQKACITDIKDVLKDNIKLLKDKAKQNTKDCKKGDIKCKEDIKKNLDKDIEKLKDEAKEKETDCKIEGNKCKDRIKTNEKINKKSIKEDLKFDIKECENEPEYVNCKNKANEKYTDGKNKINKDDPCAIKKEQLQNYVKLQKEIIDNKLKEFVENEKKKIKRDEESFEEINQEWKDLRNQIITKSKEDRSQQLQLESCLKSSKSLPEYEKILKGQIVEYMEDDNSVIEEDLLTNDTKANIYIINGHGAETLVDFNKRQTLPDNKVLIVFPICAKFNYMNISCKFMDIFNNPKNLKWMMDPLKYQSSIENELGYPIRIFLPGDKVPVMSTTLFLEFEKEKTVIAKSGVFEVTNIPEINRKRFKGTNEMKYSLGDSSCFKYSGIINDKTEYNKQIHHEVFKGNVFSKCAQLDTFSKLSRRRFNVMDIMNDVGPGIYFYTGCRAFFGNIPEKLYENILLKSASQQKEKNRDAKMKIFKPYLKIETKEQLPDSPIEEKEEDDQENTEEEDIIEEDNKVDEKTKIKKLNKIKKDTHSLLENSIDFTEKERTEAINKITEWINELEKMDIEIPRDITDIFAILKEEYDYEESIQIKKEKKYYSINQTYIYVIDKKKYTIISKNLGILPIGMKNVSIKCDTNILIKRIKKIYKDGKLSELEIPKKLSDYTEEGFINLCKNVKDLVLGVKIETKK